MRRRGGFTLVEILVVVAIIALLSALLLGGMEAINAKSEISKTQSMLQALAAVETEYRAQNQGNPVVMRGTPTPEEEADSIKTFLHEVWDLPECQKMLHVYEQYLVYDDKNNDGKPDDDIPDAMLDAWDKPLQYRSASQGEQPPFKKELNPDPDDPDPQSEYGVLPKRGSYPLPGKPDIPDVSRPFFASAGPDGDFGDTEGDSEKQEEAIDNIYSFNLE